MLSRRQEYTAMSPIDVPVRELTLAVEEDGGGPQLISEKIKRKYYLDMLL